MRSPDMFNLRSAEWIGAAADKIQPWLPPAVQWLLCVPFYIVMFVVCMTEYGLRLLITPEKYWD